MKSGLLVKRAEGLYSMELEDKTSLHDLFFSSVQVDSSVVPIE